VGSPAVKDVVEDLEEYLENVDYLKSSTTSSLKRCRWYQIIDMLNNRQISPKRNYSTLAIPWCFYKISRAFDGFSTSIIWQKYHLPKLKHRAIFPLLPSSSTFVYNYRHIHMYICVDYCVMTMYRPLNMNNPITIRLCTCWWRFHKMFTHLRPHVQGSLFQYSYVSKLPMNTQIPCS